jgi:ATP-dependent Clp protease ATP-binding subunit ClpA
MFEKFTERSRRVVALAEEEAGTLNHSCVGSEHLLLGTLREGAGVGAQALESLGITYQAVRSKATEIAGEQQPLDRAVFTPDAKRALERSLAEASRLGHGYVGTESLLLALISEVDGTAARVLVQLGADLDRVRLQVGKLLGLDHGPAFFERFTDRSKRVLVLAQEEARALNHGHVGSEHILLGLIDEGGGVAVKALESQGINLEALRHQVKQIIGHGQQAPSHIPFTAGARKVLALSLREASELGHGYIGTEHILLGLISEGVGVAAQLLAQRGVNADGARQQMIKLLHGQAQAVSGPGGVSAEVGGRGRAVAAEPGLAPVVADIVDHETKQLLDDAVQEAQEAGDRAIGGQHVLLGMCLRDNSGWLALRWAGAAPRQLMAAAMRATSNGSPHKASVPLSRELRQAMDDGWRASGEPLSAAALLAALMRNQEPGAMQTVLGAGLLGQDVLAAIAALARIGEVDAAAGELASSKCAEPTLSRPSPAPDGAPEGEDHREERQRRRNAVTAARGWAGPDREAAMSMRQFQFAAVSGIYLLLLVSSLSALVLAAIHGRLWLLLLAPLAVLGNPRFGTWSIVPVAALFWWIHLPVVAILVIISIPLDVMWGTLMVQRHDIAECLPGEPSDLRITARHVARAAGLGAGVGK